MQQTPTKEISVILLLLLQHSDYFYHTVLPIVGVRLIPNHTVCNYYIIVQNTQSNY